MGVSGGVDSSVVAHLCVRALGRKKTWMFFLPERGVTPPEDKRDVRTISKQLGIQVKTIDIAPLLKPFRGVLRPHLLALANLKARIRMCILYYHANARRALVVGTGNRSELRMGYFTKYGDGGCDLLPLGALYKTQVRALARYLGVPQSIIEKTPSAGLWPGQTDEAELGLSYEVLDRVLVALDLGFAPAEIARALHVSLAVVRKVIRREASNQHKLSPPVVPVL